MPDCLEDAVRSVAEASKCSTEDIAVLAAGLARIGESAKEVFERIAESMDGIRTIYDEQKKQDSSRQRFREKGKRRW